MSSKTINITLPTALVAEIDKAAKAEYTSRSDYIRDSLVRKLRVKRVVELDEWGDTIGEWRPLIDFREAGYPDGIPAKELLVLMKEEQARRQKNGR